MARIKKYSNKEAEEQSFVYELIVKYSDNRDDYREEIITNNLRANTTTINNVYTFDFVNDGTSQYAEKKYNQFLKKRNVKEIILNERWRSKTFGISRMTLLHDKI